LTEVVVFDLGGVLVRLGGAGALGRLVGESDEEAVWRLWLGCPWVRRYERGLCTRAEFARGMVERYRLPLSEAEFLESFRRWPLGLYEGAAELVAALAPGLRRACFSNTNELHWGEQRDAWRLGGLFHHTFVSHEIGLVKPDREAFEHVLAALGCRPAAILFLDDNAQNVAGARAAGLDAERVLGPAGAREILAARGLLVPDRS
jgi:putative hydrolase of the HAD superfamily